MPDQRLREEWRNILLELLLAIGHELDVTKQLKAFLPAFIRKLSCQAVAVFEADMVFYREYHLIAQLPRDSKLAPCAALLPALGHEDGQVLLQDKVGSVYAFELPGFGYLCLKHADLSDIFRNEMRQLCLRLSYTLTACRQHQLLQRSKRELDQFFELSDNFMCMINAQGHFIKVNPAFSKKLGYTIDEIYTIPFVDFVHPQDQSLTIENFNGLFADDISISFKNRMLHKDGHYLDLAWDMGMQVSTSVVYATAIDITSQLEIERNLLKAKIAAEQTAQAKAAFLANMSHEIRTPLNGVLGTLELLSLQGVDDKIKNQLHVAMQNGRNLLVIVNDVLDFSKMSAGKLVLEQKNFNLTALLTEMMESFEYLAQEKKLQLKLDTTEVSHDWLVGDQYRLKQILNNLLGNAFKFTSQGYVELCAKSEVVADCVKLTLSVADTGIGLSKTQQQHMFDAFSQADVSTTRRYGGTGLGLTISKELVELMRGTIQVQSVLGFGSVFTITALLTAGREEQLNSLALAEVDACPWAAQRFLLVEDNETNRMIGVAMLKHLQCQVETAEHGLAALECLQQAAPGHFDAILMDCMMPELDGYGATQMIRLGKAGQHWQNIPILALTANAMPEDRQKCLNAGMDAYLTKPFSLEQLEQSLSALLFQLETPAAALAEPAPEPEPAPVNNSVNPAPVAIDPQALVISEPLWQKELFLEKFKGMEDCCGDMLDMFSEHLPATALDLQSAFDGMDYKKLCLLSHSLKGSSAQVGCSALNQAAKNLEMAIKNQQDDTVPDNLEYLLYVLKQTAQVLQRE